MTKWNNIANGHLSVTEITVKCSLCRYAQDRTTTKLGISACFKCPLCDAKIDCHGFTLGREQSMWNRMNEFLESGELVNIGFTHKLKPGYFGHDDANEFKFLIYKMRDAICGLYYEESDRK